jgi:hypothetical protein
MDDMSCCRDDPAHWEYHEDDYATHLDTVCKSRHSCCEGCMSSQIHRPTCKDKVVLTVLRIQVQISIRATSLSKAFELFIWPVSLVSSASVRTASHTCVMSTARTLTASSTSSTSITTVQSSAPVPWPTNSSRTAGSAFHASSSKRPELTVALSRKRSSSGRQVKMDRASLSGLRFVQCGRYKTTADFHQKHLCDCGRVADIDYLVSCRWCEEYILTPQVDRLIHGRV